MEEYFLFIVCNTLLKHLEYMHEFHMITFVFIVHLSGVRLEEYFYEKVQGKKPILQVDEGLLGQFMVQAGNQFDAGTPYGKSTCTGLRLAERRYSKCKIIVPLI